MEHFLDVAAVDFQVGRKGIHRLVAASLGGDQQPLLVEVMHDGDVALPAVHADVVDAHVAHVAHVIEGASLADEVRVRVHSCLWPPRSMAAA